MRMSHLYQNSTVPGELPFEQRGSVLKCLKSGTWLARGSFYTMRAPFFGGGRGDWGEQDETVAVLEGGLEVEVQCIGLFP